MGVKVDYDLSWLLGRINYDLTDAHLRLDKAVKNAGRDLKYSIDEVFEKGKISGLESAKEYLLRLMKVYEKQKKELEQIKQMKKIELEE